MKVLGHDLLLTLADFDSNQLLGEDARFSNLVATAVGMFFAIWVVHAGLFLLYSAVCTSKIFQPRKARAKLSRHTTECLCMSGFFFLGWECWVHFGGFEGMKHLVINGNHLDFGAPRLYLFSAAAQRLATCQVAYEAKNFCDSLIDNDGILFLAHHFVTGLVSAMGWNPFLHLYAAFYLGLSELSTAVLCLLVMFDEEKGIPGVGEAYPIMKKLLGVTFALLFTAFRIVMWPWVNYYFWTDMWTMHESSGSFHNDFNAYFFLVVNVFLTILQIAWFGEILSKAKELLFAGDKQASAKKSS